MRRQHYNSVFPHFLFEYPATLFGVCLILYHITFLKLVTLTLLVTGTSCWQAVVTTAYNLQLHARFYFQHLLVFRYCTYTQRPLSDYLSQDLYTHLLTERFGIRLTVHPLGYVCVVRRKKGNPGKPVPSTWTTIPFETTPWYILMWADPSELTSYQRFLLLHEIGHTSLYHRIALERELNAPVQALFMLLTFGLLAHTNFISVTPVVLGLTTWVILIWRHRVSNNELEKLADRFAILFLDENDISKVKIHFHKLYDESATDTRCAKENGERVSAFDEGLDARYVALKSGDLKTLQQAYNSYAIALAWPRWYVYFVLLIAAATASFATGQIKGTDIGHLCVASLAIPTVFWLVIRRATDIYDDRLQLVMKLGEVPPQIIPTLVQEAG